MFNNRILALVATLVFTIPAFAQPKERLTKTPERPAIMPISEVREGMRGVARTVFRGNKPEEFNVEILGVIPNLIGPKQDMIVGKLSGANADRTGVFSGMSGSPVYVDGKLIGAISYSFPFAKEPIAGITPFEQMSSVMESAEAAGTLRSSSLTTFSLAELAADRWRPAFAEPARGSIAGGFAANSRLAAIAGQSFVPISTPLYFSGISQKTIDIFAEDFARAGIMPIAAAGGASEIKPMVPYNENTLLGGDSIVVSLARGDVSIAAAGTVTLRDGERIYAFGHPFFSLGSANLPMSESHVVTVIPNANNSFKLTVPDATVGAMTQDRATAIYGKLGQAPKMLPVSVKLTNSRGKTAETKFESAFDDLLTPLIVSAGVGNVLAAQERSVGETTIEMKGEIRVKGEQPIKIERKFAGNGASALAGAAPAIPLQALLRANFEGMEITGVDLALNAVDGSRTAAIDQIAIDRNTVRAGDTVNVLVSERTAAGIRSTRRVLVKIPADVAPGSVTLTIGDGGSVQQNTAITQFTPRTVAELIATINRLKRSDKLYAVLSRPTTATIIGANEMPNLPPSMLATLNNDRTAGGVRTSAQMTLLEFELPSGDHIVSGSQSITLEVVR